MFSGELKDSRVWGSGLRGLEGLAGVRGNSGHSGHPGFWDFFSGSLPLTARILNPKP